MSDATRPDSLAPGGAVRSSAETDKLITLARGARARASAAEGAAVLDDMGRSYAAASVELPQLNLTAVQAAVAAAVSSGSRALDAAVVLRASGDIAAADRELLESLGASQILTVPLG